MAYSSRDIRFEKAVYIMGKTRLLSSAYATTYLKENSPEGEGFENRACAVEASEITRALRRFAPQDTEFCSHSPVLASKIRAPRRRFGHE